MASIDLTGQTFGRLVVIRQAEKEVRFGKRLGWQCRCACGTITTVIGYSLRRGLTNSCGCLSRDTSRQRHWKHGLVKTRAYRSWYGAKTRCYNKKQRAYKDYGARGITMCQKWRSDFMAFLRDMGPCPVGHSIDRIDHNGNYEPGNCRWVKWTVQANNTRANHRIEFRGESKTVSEWERELGFQAGTVKNRLRRGWLIDRALTAPLR